MVKLLVRSYLFSVSLALFTIGSAGMQSCNDDAPSESNSSNTVTTTAPAAEITIGATDHTIRLLQGYKITYDMKGDAHYFEPTGDNFYNSQAGVYFGEYQKKNPPDTEYTERSFKDSLMGDTVTWIEYTSMGFVHREAFYQDSIGNKTHAWCYSKDAAELERLFRMIQTIR